MYNVYQQVSNLPIDDIEQKVHFYIILIILHVSLFLRFSMAIKEGGVEFDNNPFFKFLI